MTRSTTLARPARLSLLLILAVAMTALITTAVPTSAHATFSLPGPKVKVMTRNMYFGADLTRAIAAPSLPDFVAANAQIFTNVEASDIDGRARAIAREIAWERPDLVGLQEVSKWLSGPFLDPADATTVEYDQLESLLYWLKRYGAPYKVVKSQSQIEIEAPAGAPYGKDFRLVDRDVILAPVLSLPLISLSNAAGGNFAAQLTITSGIGQSITVKRGWTSVDAKVLFGGKFRFVNTHLESFHPGFRAAQAGELVAPAGPIGSAPGKVVLVGDINSDPAAAFPDNLAFGALLSAGMIDTWPAENPGDPGNTCCFTELVDDPSPVGLFTQRIDHVMTRGGVDVTHSELIGLDPNNRTAGDLWPSDHAGVVTTVRP